MRTSVLPLLATLCLMGLSGPASADVTVDEPLPGHCRGTQGAYGFWGEAWVGSGHPTAAGPCHLHATLHTPWAPAQEASGPDRCVELEWDTGVTQYVCVLQGGSECGLLEAGEYGPGSQGLDLVCISDRITAAGGSTS